MENYKKNDKKFRLPLSAYLSYLLLAAFLFTGVTLSSYVTSTSDATITRSAKFQVIVGSQAKELVINVNEDKFTDKFDFTVKSNSEVSAYYDIIVDLKTALPEGLTMKLDTLDADSVENNVYTFNRVGEFAPLDNSEHIHSLIFTATENLAENINLEDLQIKVLMSQKI